jgi:hypothetical protein
MGAKSAGSASSDSPPATKEQPVSESFWIEREWDPTEREPFPMPQEPSKKVLRIYHTVMRKEIALRARRLAGG